MNNIFPLNTNRLSFRKFNLSDANQVQLLCNDARISSTTINIPSPYTLIDAERWIQSQASHEKLQNCFTFAIQLQSTQTVIGAVSLRITAHKNKREGLLSYWIGTNFWNQGFCTEAAEAVIQHGFKQLKLTSINAQHMDKNPASGRVLKKLGFTYECSNNVLITASKKKTLMLKYSLTPHPQNDQERLLETGEDITNQTNKKLIEVVKKHQAAGLFLGGSQSRGTNDIFSDRDFGCLYTPQRTNLSLFVNELEDEFGNILDIVEKGETFAYHFKDQQSRFEVRLTTIDEVINLCKELATGNLLTPCQQDLLSNIKFGQYLHLNNDVKEIRSKIEYTDSLKNNVISSYLPLLTTEVLQIPIYRGDCFLIFNYGAEIYSTALLLGLAQAKQFNSSLKHESNLRQYLSIEAKDFLNALKLTLTHQTKEKLQVLQEMETIFTNSLRREIESSQTYNSKQP